MHGRHFTFQGMSVENEPSVIGGNVITFVSETVKGSWATRDHPYASRGTWLHVLLTDAFAEKVEAAVSAVLAASPEVRHFYLVKKHYFP
jgi:suppressor of fused-like protein